MSLRFRLVAVIAILLAAAIAAGGAIAGLSARAQVRAEMHGAMAAARDILHDAVDREADQPQPDFVASLVRSFNGQRHLVAWGLDAHGRALAHSQPMAGGAGAPGWFRALIGPESVTERVILAAPAALAGTEINVATEPTNEIDEVWRQTSQNFLLLMFFCVSACVAVYLIAGNALARFSAFGKALAAVGEGRYDTALAEQGPPEFVALARGFNRMAARLSDYETRTRALNEQILTLQAEERAEIARDLHDEVGPHLFAIKVDADDIPNLSDQGHSEAVRERVVAIRESAGRIQKHVRAILRQLRPSVALDLGLEAAVTDLVAFWRKRCPSIRFEVACELGDGPLGRRCEDVAYRVIQESLCNAIRHGLPEVIAVTLSRSSDGGLVISVADNGGGFEGPPSAGTAGLSGMSERVRVLGGELEISSGDDGGVCTRASLPADLGLRLGHDQRPHH